MPIQGDVKQIPVMGAVDHRGSCLPVTQGRDQHLLPHSVEDEPCSPMNPNTWSAELEVSIEGHATGRGHSEAQDEKHRSKPGWCTRLSLDPGRGRPQ